MEWNIQQIEKEKQPLGCLSCIYTVKVVLIIEMIIKQLPPCGRVPFISQSATDKTFKERKSPILLKNSFPRLELRSNAKYSKLLKPLKPTHKKRHGYIDKNRLMI
jgi:hypothetical protein